VTMTPTLPPPDVLDRMSTTERRALAEQIWRESIAAGRPITASELGPMVGRSPAWGRRLVQALTADRRPTAGRLQLDDPPSRNGDGPHRVERPAPVEATSTSSARTGGEPGRPGRRTSGRAEQRVTTFAVIIVALVAAVASFDHQRLLAEAAGEGWRSWLLPLSVDGLILSASMTMRARRRAGEPAGALAWCALLLGVAASLAANVAAAEPTVVGRLVAAWPPLALLLAHELLHRQHRAADQVRTLE
jgi:hypothetical protein